MRRTGWLGSFFLLGGLLGCTPVVLHPPSQVEATISFQTSSPLAETALPTQLVSGVIPGSVQTINPDQALPLIDPYSFAVQQPITDTIAEWRPPLYPTPWIPTPYDHFLFSRPVLADMKVWALEDYRYGGVFFRNVVHTGIDIPLKVGSPVYAAGSGRVAWSGFGLMSGETNPDDPYGLAVVIRHDFGYQGQTLYTVYGHLSETNLVIGQPVKSGEVIGLSGATGKVTGPHLHFEVRIGDNSFSRSRNPELWIVPPQGWGILVGQLKTLDDEWLLRLKVLIRSLDSGERYWVATYGEGPVNSDPYYGENLVIGDLPAGWYRVLIPGETSQHLDIEILPGRVSFFRYKRGGGFSTDLPAPPLPAFKTPEVPTPQVELRPLETPAP
jgi:murein DD-endopeptidase MepM/ murein hydrolase activator NlpD